MMIQKCKGKAHLEQLLTDVTKNKGGEEIMLRKPGSHYEWKRSATKSQGTITVKLIAGYFEVDDHTPPDWTENWAQMTHHFVKISKWFTQLMFRRA